MKKEGTKASLIDVRRIQKEEHPEWAFDCPQRIREYAMNDACEAVKNAKIKYKKVAKFQDVSYRSRKDSIQGFAFDPISLNDEFVFKEKDKKLLFWSSEDFDKPLLTGTRLVCEDYRCYVIIPEKRVIKKPENQRCDYVAIDPGVRTFATFYSELVHGKIGEGDFKKIYRLCLGLDKLSSKISKAKCKIKRNMKRAAARARWKIWDLIDDLHKKTSYFLVTRFNTIFLPTFETSQMVSKLRSKTARSMLSFAHYRFKSFLKSKAEEYSCQVIDCNEAYTSKTCSFCGKIHKIGGKKVMKCECGVLVDRDYNGARGIYLRALMALSPLQEGNC